MSRGSYLGGSTFIRGAGVHAPKGPQRHGRGASGTGPEHEKRKRQKREQQKEQRAHIRANEKLVRKLSKQWREEEGKRHFQALTDERRNPASNTPAAGNILAQALQQAFSKQKDAS